MRASPHSPNPLSPLLNLNYVSGEGRGGARSAGMSSEVELPFLECSPCRRTFPERECDDDEPTDAFPPTPRRQRHP